MPQLSANSSTLWRKRDRPGSTPLPPSPAPFRPPAPMPRSLTKFSAFTLIELLTVIAIIGVLAGITFGIAKGVQERAGINQARTELAALAAVLENYKKHYGDYPRITTTTADDGALQLFQALNGQRGPTGTSLNPRQKAVLEAGRFNLEDQEAPVLADNRILDPWGRAYRYLYNPTDSSWSKRPYLLFSLGPTTGADDVGTMTDGVAETTGTHADNIYANN